MIRFLRSLAFTWLFLVSFLSAAHAQEVIDFEENIPGTVWNNVVFMNVFQTPSIQVQAGPTRTYNISGTFSYTDLVNGFGCFMHEKPSSLGSGNAFMIAFTDASDKVVLQRTDGSMFKIESLTASTFVVAQYTFKGYRGTNLVATETHSISTAVMNIPFSSDDWKMVSKVEISAAGLSDVLLDNITLGEAVFPQFTTSLALISSHSYTWKNTITNIGSVLGTETGFDYSYTGTPTDGQNRIVAHTGTVNTGGVYTVNGPAVPLGSRMYVRGYVKTADGIYYGNVVKVVHPTPSPIITLLDPIITNAYTTRFNLDFTVPVSLPELNTLLTASTIGALSAVGLTVSTTDNQNYVVSVTNSSFRGLLKLSFTGNENTTYATPPTTVVSDEYSIDHVKPVISTTGPAAIGGDRNVTFSLSSNEPGTFYMVKDGAAAVAVTSPLVVTDTYGDHSVTFYQIDEAGNQSANKGHIYTIREYPIATFTSKPPVSDKQISATFNVTADYTATSYNYYLDGALQSGNGATITLNGLADGPHTLEVAGVGATGVEQSTKTVYTWTVDTQPPPAPAFTGLGNDSGISATDRIINYNTNLVINGTSEPGATVTTVINSTTANDALAGPDGSWSVTFPTLPVAGSYYFVHYATDVAGNRGSNSAVTTFTVDLTRPTVTSIAQPPAGDLRPGQYIEFIATMSEPIDGYPNSCSMFYTYAGQSYEFEFGGFQDGNKIIFRYVIQPGESFTNMFQSGWTFNGIIADHGDMMDVAGNQADFTTVPAPVVTNVINADPTAPAVTGDPVITDGNYVLSNEVLVTRTFSENVFVTGNPGITLIIGSEVGTANYFSGSGTNTLTFKYVVPIDVEGTVEAYKHLSMAGATIRDAAGNNATGVSDAGSVTNSNAIVDSKPPRYTGVQVITPYSTGGQDVHLDILYDEDVLITTPPVPYIEAMVGGVARQFNYAFTNGKRIRFKWNVPPDVEDHDGIELSDAMKGSGLVIKDAFDNPAVLDFGDSIRITSGLIIDSKAPVITEVVHPTDGFYRSGAVLLYTVKFNETLIVGPTYPTLTLMIGGIPHSLNYWSGDGTKELKFQLAVLPGMNEATGVTVSGFAAGSVTDFYGNPYVSSGTVIPSGSEVVIDNTPPLATSFTTTSGNYKLGDEILFEIGYNEEMMAFGSNLALEVQIGARTEYLPLTLSADKLSLQASYTVVAGDEDLDGIGITYTIRSRDGTSHLRDRAGNQFTLAIPAGTLYAINVDGNAPHGTGHQVFGNYYKPGDVLKINVTFSETVSVTSGVPELDIVTGATELTLQYTGQPGPTMLTYELTIPTGVPCGRIDGIQFSTLTRTGVISDQFGNTILPASNFTMVDHHWFDNCAPVITNTLEFSLNEKPAAGTFVGQPTANESPDASRTLTWEISGQTDLGGHGLYPLEINTATGEITVKDPDGFRFAVAPEVTAQVRVYDGGNWSNYYPVTVTVLDVSDAPTDITLSDNTINEDAPSGATVGTFTSTDDDAGETFTYTLVTGTGSTDNGTFSITGNSLVTNMALQRSVKASYAIRVRTTDSDGLFMEKAFTINVADTSRPVITWQTPVEGASLRSPFYLYLQTSEPLTGLALTDFNVTGVNVSELTQVTIDRYFVLLTPAADGTFTISMADGAATDEAGNLSRGPGSRTLTYDRQDPRVIQNILTTSPTTGNIEFELTFSERIKPLSAANLMVSNGTATLTTTDDQHYHVTIVPEVSGEVYWRIDYNMAQDFAGNPSQALGDFSVHYDVTRPKITLSSTPVGPKVNSAVTVWVILSDQMAALQHSYFTVDNAVISNITQVSSKIYTLTLTPTDEGAFSIQFNENQFQDGALNWNEASNKLDLEYDNTPPTATLTTTAPAHTNVSPIPVTLTFSEEVTSMDPLFLNTASSATVQNLTTTDNITWTFDLVPSAEGDVVVVMPAGYVKDLADNLNTGRSELSLKYDVTRPAPIFHTSPSGGLFSPVHIRIMFMEAMADFEESDVTLTNGTITDFVQVNPREYTFTITGTPNTQGDMVVGVAENVATDLAGNGNTANSVAVAYDVKGPDAAISYTGPATVTGPFTVVVDVNETVYGFAADRMFVINGTVNSFSYAANKYTIGITPENDGPVIVEVPSNAMADAASNGNTAVSVTVQYDLDPPTVTIQTPFGTPVNDAFPVSIVFSEAVTGFVAGDFGVTNGTVTDWATTDNITFTCTVTPTSEGVVLMTVAAGVAADVVNRPNLAATGVSIYNDVTEPVAQLVSHTTSPTNGMISMTLTFTERVYGFTDADVTITNGTIANYHTDDDIVYTFNVLPAGEGIVHIVIHPGAGRDRAGNATTYDIVSVWYDITAPEATITSSATSPTNAVIPFTITFTEKVNNFLASDLQVTNGTVSGFTTTDNITWDFTVTPAADGTVSVGMLSNVAADDAGNPNNAATAHSVTYDATPPDVTLATTAASPVNGTFTVTATFTEPVFDFIQTDIIVSNGAASAFTVVDASTYTFTVTPSSGPVSISLPAGVGADLCGNGNIASNTLVLQYDNIRPAVILATTAISPTNAGIPVILTFSEAVTGFVAGDITVTNGSVAGLATSDLINWTFTVMPAASGQVTVNVAADVAIDGAGNGNTAATQLAVVYDNTQPDVTITTTATGIINAPIPVTVAFTEEIKDFSQGDIVVANGNISGFTTSDSRIWKFVLTPVADGVSTINLAAGVATDLAGNTNSVAAELSVEYDGSRPAVTLTAGVSSPTKELIPVTISFSETVDGFDASDLVITNGTISRFVAIDQQSYIIRITPAGEGVVTISLPANIAKDAGNNENTAGNTLQLVYDITVPGAAFTTTAVSPVRIPFPVTLTFTEPVAGLDISDIMVGNGAVSALTTIDQQSWTFTVTPVTDGWVSINMAAGVATDAAGNGNAAAAELAVEYDGLQPVAVMTTTVTSPVNAAFPVTVTFSEAVTGFDAGDISITNGTVSNFTTTNNIIYTFTVTPVATGNVNIQVAADVANDAAGNGNTASAQLSLTYDASLVGTSITTTANSPVNAAFPVTVTFTKAVTGFAAGDVSITNGAISNFATSDNITYTFTVTPATTGSVTINVAAGVATDGAGNGNSAAAELVVEYDGLQPVAVVTTTAISPVNAAFPVTVTFSEAVTGFDAGDISITNGTVSNFTTSNNIIYTFIITPVATGNVTIQVAADVANDAAGNGNTASAQLSLTYDASLVGTSITTTANSPVNAAFPVTVTFTKAVTGFAAGDVSITNGAISNFTTSDNIAYTFTVTSVTTGSVTINVAVGVATDVAGNGNAAAAELAVEYDATRPGASITTTATSPVNAAFPVTVTFSEAVTGFDAGDISITNGTISDFTTTNNIIYTFTITPVATGNVTIQVAADVANDAAGNGNTASAQLSLTYDASLVGTSITTTANSPVNATFTVTVTFTKAVTGFAAGDVSITNGAISNFATSDNITYTFTVTPATTGSVTINVAAGVATDAAGNGNSAAAELVVEYDGLQPVAVMTTTAISPVNAAFPVTVTFSEAVTGFDAGDISITNGTVSNFTTSNNIIYTFTITPVATGNVTIQVAADVANDAAGNGNTASAQLSLTYDASLVGTSITTTATSPVNAAFPVTVTFTKAVTGFAAGDVSITNGAISNFATSDNITYTFTVTPATTGSVTINVAADVATDMAGNGNSAAAELAVEYDATRPGASITTTATSPVNTSFPVTVTFSEAVTGFASGDVAVTNGTISNFATSDNITFTFTVTPVATGSVTINVAANAASDAAGNGNTAAATWVMEYDGSRPTVNLTIQPASGSNYNVTATFSEPVTGLGSSGIMVTNGVVSDIRLTGTNTYTFVVTALAAGELTVQIAANAAADAAGNGNIGSNMVSANYNNVGPAVTITSPAANIVNHSFNITITFTSPVTGFTASDVDVTNGSLQNLTASGDRAYTATILPVASGQVSLFVRAGAATDAGGLANTVSNVLSRTYDNTRPAATVSTAAVSPVNGAFTVQIRFSEKVNGFSAAGLQLRNAVADPVTTSDNRVFTTVVRPTGGLIEVSVLENAATDDAGNSNTASATLSLSHDDILPSVVLTGRDNIYASGPFTLTIQLSEPSPDFSANAIQLENGTLSKFTRISDTRYTATVTPNFAGPVMRIFIPANRYSDAAGNRNTASNILSYRTLQSYTIQSVYPNPTSGKVFVKFEGVIRETIQIQLLSMTGEVVYRKDVAPMTSEIRLDIPDAVRDGVYQVVVSNGPVKRFMIVLVR